MNIVKRSLILASGLAVISLALGIFVGGVAGLTTHTAEAAGALSASAYRLLALLLPLGLGVFLAAWVDQDEALYTGWGGALAVPLLAGLLGALFARLGYVWAATFGASVLSAGKLDAFAVNVATQARLSGLALWGVLLVTLVGALAVGAWAHAKVNKVPFT